MLKHLYLIMLLLFTIVGGQKVKAQTYDNLVFGQDGLYYYVDDYEYAILLDGAIAVYYLEHHGDMTGWDYLAEHEILPGYRGNVTVPAQVTHQGKVYLVDGVTGFDNNPYLTSLTVHAELSSFGLSNAPALSSLTLTNTSKLTTISLGQTALTTYHLPATVTSANFSNNPNMKSVTVSSGNPMYMSVNGMLANKPSQTNWNILYVPEGMEGTLVLPEGITGCVGIASCSKITEVVIPSTFNPYSLHTLLAYTEGIKVTIGSSDADFAVIDDFITNRAQDSIIYILPSSQAETLTIPEGIRHGDFSHLASITYGWEYDSETGVYYQDFNSIVLGGNRPHVKTINLPSSFEGSAHIEYYSDITIPMTSAYELVAINVASGNPYFASVDGILMDKKKERIIAVPANHAAANAIPNGTKYIYDRAMMNNRNLTNVSIPSTVETIGTYAFAYCSNLKEVSVPQNTIMGEYAFSYCISLQSAHLPAMNYVPRSTFEYCKSLTSVEIPSQVTSIQDQAFSGCKSLTQINLPDHLTEIQSCAFQNCTQLKNITLPNTLVTLGGSAFFNATSLQSLTIPASVSYIGNRLTEGCPLIERITVAPNNATYCDQDGVIFSADKQSLVLFPSSRKGAYAVPEGTVAIKDYAFYNASQLTDITFPEGLQRVGYSSLYGCTGIKMFDFPASTITFDSYWFTVDNYNSVDQPERRIIFRTDKYLSSAVLNYIPSNSRVYVQETNFDSFVSTQLSNKNSGYTVFCLSKPFAISKTTRYLRGIRFNIVENDLTDMEKTLGEVTVNPNAQQSNVKSMQKLADGTWFVKTLKPDNAYDINIGYKVNGSNESMRLKGCKTKSISCGRNYTSTQSTATITYAYIRNAEDTTAVATKYEMSVADQTFDMTNWPNHSTKTPIALTGLTPGTAYPMNFTVTYDDGEQATSSTNLRTQSFDAYGIDYVLTPTTLRLNISYKEIDAVPDSIAIVFNPASNYSQRDTLYASITRPVFTGLTPGTKYRNNGVYFVMKGKILGTTIGFSNLYYFETPQLQLATEQPKIPAQGRAFVEATTNTGNDEGRMGFEWRKYDAPSEMKSMEAYAVVYDGRVQGLLKDLSTSHYYKVRAFYDDMDGVRYYANNGPNNDGWITFDPSEVSQMNAVVHTNADPSPTNTTVQLVGVVIQGSEDIVEQGFEYWEVVTDENGNMSRHLVRRAEATGEHHTIAVNGQGISVEITGLTPGTDYAFRAYAKTANGIVYGEERSFHTNGEKPDGIEEMSVAKQIDIKASCHLGTLSLCVNGQGEKALVTIVSVNGKMLFRQTVIADGSTVEVPGMPRGMIIVNVRTPEAEKTLKTIVR